ncbi:unnamed protein product [Alopecurus aequalis]
MAGGSRRQSPPPIRSAIKGRAVHGGSSSQAGSSAWRAVHVGSSLRGSSSSRVDVEFPSPPPPQRYLGVRQRAWGSWVAEITGRVTHKRRWIDTYQTARQAAYAYDCETRFLNGPTAPVNFPDGLPDDEKPDLGPVDPREHAKLDSFRTERYGPPGCMKEEPYVVKQESCQRWGLSDASRPGGCPSSAPPVVDLTGEDSDNSSYFSGADWRALEGECTDSE